MPSYRYKAVDKNGKPTTGEMACADRQELMDRLRDQGLSPLSIEQSSEEATADKAPPSEPSKRSGLSLNSGLKQILEGVGRNIQRGASFSQALAEHPRVFDEMYLNMIRVGELGGTLASSVNRLALPLTHIWGWTN